MASHWTGLIGGTVGVRSGEVKQDKTRGSIRFDWLPVLVLGLAACSETSLSDLGNRSSGWLDVTLPTSTTLIAETSVLSVRPVAGVVWFNDDLGIPENPTPDAVIHAVRNRSLPGDRFLPASRFEIAVVIPQLKFPDVVPVEVDAVTSQLVAPGESGLTAGEVAAFGMWAGEPYASSRSVGQVGTLEVDLLEEGAEPITCAERGPGCETMVAAGKVGVLVSDSSGRTWSWDDSGLRYHLFLRSVTSDVAAAMIGAFQPLPLGGSDPVSTVPAVEG